MCSSDLAAAVPDGATYDAAMGEFILPYDVVRAANDPDALVMAFLQATYTAAASLGAWDRDDLECALGIPNRPRSVQS